MIVSMLAPDVKQTDSVEAAQVSIESDVSTINPDVHDKSGNMI